MPELVLNVAEVNASIAQGLAHTPTHLIRARVFGPTVPLQRLRKAARVVVALRAARDEELPRGDELIVEADDRAFVAFRRRDLPEAALEVNVRRGIRPHQLNRPLATERQNQESRARLRVA